MDAVCVGLIFLCVAGVVLLLLSLLGGRGGMGEFVELDQGWLDCQTASQHIASIVRHQHYTAIPLHETNTDQMNE